MNSYCEIERCGHPSRYIIRWADVARWVMVCGNHDVQIAHRNLRALGLSAGEAKEWGHSYIADPDSVARLESGWSVGHDQQATAVAAETVSFEMRMLVGAFVKAATIHDTCAVCDKDLGGHEPDCLVVEAQRALRADQP